MLWVNDPCTVLTFIGCLTLKQKKWVCFITFYHQNRILSTSQLVSKIAPQTHQSNIINQKCKIENMLIYPEGAHVHCVTYNTAGIREHRTNMTDNGLAHVLRRIQKGITDSHFITGIQRGCTPQPGFHQCHQ